MSDKTYSESDFDLLLKQPLAKADFDETKHPRGNPDNAGQFTSGGAGKQAQTPKKAMRRVRDKTDVPVNEEPKAKLVAGRAIPTEKWESLKAVTDYAALSSAGFQYGGDKVLESLAHDQGFDGLPDVRSKDEIDKLVAGGARELFRGVSSGYYSLMDSPEDVAKAATKYSDQFKFGDYFGGTGVAGNGTYVSMKRDVAKGYTGLRRDGDLMRMVLHPDAKILKYSDPILHTVSSKFAAEKEVEYSQKRKEQWEIASAAMKRGASDEEMAVIEKAMRANLDSLTVKERAIEMLPMDEGRLATLLGYDALDAGDMMVILNRTALIVQKESAK